MTSRADSTAAARQRRYRARRRAGRRSWRVDLSDDLKEQLVSDGLMTPQEIADDASFATQLGTLIEAALFSFGERNDATGWCGPGVVESPDE